MASRSRAFSSWARLIVRNQSSAASATVLRRVPAPPPASSAPARRYSASVAGRGTASRWRRRGEDSGSERDDDERFRPDAINRKIGVFNRKVRRHKELLKNFEDSGIRVLHITTKCYKTSYCGFDCCYAFDILHLG